MDRKASTMNIIDLLRCDPYKLNFNQAEQVLAILKLTQKKLVERLYAESKLSKYAQ